ncbi:glycosyltransferase [Catenuloplanes japonicus]|uniref:glycosyltransferase n=1 Tax=Catenuloplanes japonicus TaxID=33876 RepID=UPI0005277DC7|nr:glycosyltransferase [Catenuloplanes japonicus]
MRVLILTLGTRGDIQPFLTLATELDRRGHTTVVAAPQRFSGLAATHGTTFAPLDDGPLRVLDHGSAVGDVATGGIRAKIDLMRRLPGMFHQVLDDCRRLASSGADLVVHNGQVIAGQHVAELLQVPAVLALPMPMYVPTAEFAWPGASFPEWLPPGLHRATYAGMKAPAMMFGRTVDRWRHDLGLPRRPGRHDPTRRPDGGPAPVLHAFSPAVIPRPSDWPDTAQVTGYWFPPAPAGEAESPPAGMRALLHGDEPVVFAGFGSMAGPEPAALTRVVVEALDRAGVRGIIAEAGGGLSRIPADRHLFVTGEVDHRTVFPRCAAVLHHGGAGTTAAVARAGRPQIICPFVGDQPFWAARMHHLGVAPPPVSLRDLTADRLATAVRDAISDPAYHVNAHLIGQRVRAENGTTAAADALERIAASTDRR